MYKVLSLLVHGAKFEEGLFLTKLHFLLLKNQCMLIISLPLFLSLYISVWSLSPYVCVCTHTYRKNTKIYILEKESNDEFL